MAGYLNQGFLHRFFGPQQKLHPRDSKKLSDPLNNCKMVSNCSLWPSDVIDEEEEAAKALWGICHRKSRKFQSQLRHRQVHRKLSTSKKNYERI